MVVKSADKNWIWTIRDHGPGMSDEILRRVSEPFFTTKQTGTGMGLAMVYGFSKRSGGYIKADSRTGIGTTFRFYMPRATANARKQMQLSVDGLTESDFVFAAKSDQCL